MRQLLFLSLIYCLLPELIHTKPHRTQFLRKVQSDLRRNVKRETPDVSRYSPEQVAQSYHLGQISGRTVKFISDGSIAHRIVQREGRYFWEIKEMVPAGEGRFEMQTRLRELTREELRQHGHRLDEENREDRRQDWNDGRRTDPRYQQEQQQRERQGEQGSGHPDHQQHSQIGGGAVPQRSDPRYEQQGHDQRGETPQRPDPRDQRGEEVAGGGGAPQRNDPYDQQQPLREDSDRRQPPHSQSNEWYGPGGQIGYPRLVFSPTYGWKEISEEEERRMRPVYTAPRGKTGLQWIEVPNTFASQTQPQRTRVAIPAVQPSKQREEETAVDGTDYQPVEVNPQSQPKEDASEDTSETGETAEDDPTFNDEQYAQKVSEIAKADPALGEEIDIERNDERPQQEKENEEETEEIESDDPTLNDAAYAQKVSDIAKADPSLGEEIELERNEEPSDQKEKEYTFSNVTKPAAPEAANEHSEREEGDDEANKISQGDVNLIEKEDMGALVYTKGEGDEEYQDQSVDNTVTDSQKTKPAVPIETKWRKGTVKSDRAVQSVTIDNPCKPMMVKSQQGSALYWLLRAVPCQDNLQEKGEVFVAGNGNAYTYYGQPQLINVQ